MEQYQKRLGGALETLQKAEQLTIKELREQAKNLIIKRAGARAQEMKQHTAGVESISKRSIATHPIQLLRLTPIFSAIIDRLDKDKAMWPLGPLIKSASSIPEELSRNAAKWIQTEYDKANQVRVRAQRRAGELESLKAKDLYGLINRLHGYESIEKILNDKCFSLEGYLVSIAGTSK